MLGRLNLFLNCLQFVKLLETTADKFLSYVAVFAFLLIHIVEIMEYNRRQLLTLSPQNRYR